MSKLGSRRSITKSNLFNRARTYYDNGFNEIPIDEMRWLNQNQQNIVNYYMRMMKKMDDLKQNIDLNPNSKFSRESVAPIGREYRKIIRDLKSNAKKLDSKKKSAKKSAKKSGKKSRKKRRR